MMKKISRKVAIKQMGLLSLSPVVPVSLIKNNGKKNSLADQSGNDAVNQLNDRILLQPFGYDEVKLQNGFLNRQVEDVIDYYLRIPNDDLLKGFRERIGLPAYGAKDLGGWYTSDTYHIFGQLLSGLSRLYAVSGNETCREKLDALIEGWAACIEPDGYFYYTKKPNAKHYIFDKMVGGLVDASLFAHNKNALRYLSIITDWAIKNLDRNTPYARTGSENGEWYTLGENLFRAYQITGEKKYFEFAQHWEYTEYWDILAKNESIFQRDVRYHAYSHLNTFSSAAMAYLLKGDEHYLDTLKNGYDFFQNEQCFATGGYGPMESLMPKEGIIKRLMSNQHNTFETQCGSWAAFKFSKYLMMFTGDARYGDWIEKLIYNATGAGIPTTPDGKVFYYSDYNLKAGFKTHFTEGWSCCSGTRTQDVAEYPNLVYFKNNEGIFVNLYTPASITWGNLTLIQKTRFPEDNLTTLKIKTSENTPVKTKIHFRKPGWLAGEPVILINGKRQNVKDIPIIKNWFVLSGNWKNNDRVEIRFPVSLASSRLDTAKEYPAAITYGPVVLAVRSGDKYPADLLSGSETFKDFIPVEGSPLNWHVKSDDEFLIKPFYSYKENERYVIYTDPSVANWIPDNDFIFSGNWKDAFNNYYYSKEKGASVEAGFQGTGVRVHLVGFPNSGKCEISIDDKPIDTVDEYKPEMGVYFHKDYTGLSKGRHTVRVKVLGEKNEKSGDTYININTFEAIP